MGKFVGSTSAVVVAAAVSWFSEERVPSPDVLGAHERPQF
jgi:hypothetical protein